MFLNGIKNITKTIGITRFTGFLLKIKMLQGVGFKIHNPGVEGSSPSFPPIKTPLSKDWGVFFGPWPTHGPHLAHK